MPETTEKELETNALRVELRRHQWHGKPVGFAKGTSLMQIATSPAR
jgi:hypothetical protein